MDRVIDDVILTDIADQIRLKRDIVTEIAPEDMALEVSLIGNGSTNVYYSPKGICYIEHMDITVTKEETRDTMYNNFYSECVNLKSIRMRGEKISGNAVSVFAGCTSLETAIIENVTKYGHYYLRSCTSLRTVQLGSIGFPVTDITIYLLRDSNFSGTLTIYVDASNVSELPETISSSYPFGALPEATIIYRNATTGEIIY